MSSTSEINDVALLRGAVSGDAAAQRSFDRQWRPFVRKVVIRIVGPRDSAVDDVVQQVFVKVFEKGDGFAELSRVSTWLYRIAFNTAISHLRKRKRETRELAREPNDFHFLTAPDVDDVTAKQRATALIDLAWGSLTEKDRDAISLCELEGKTMAEAASILGVPPQSMPGRLARGRKRLRKALEKAGFGAAVVALFVAPTRAHAWATATFALATVALIAVPLALPLCAEVSATRGVTSDPAATGATTTLSSPDGRARIGSTRMPYSTGAPIVPATRLNDEGSTETESAALPTTLSVAEAWNQFGIREGFFIVGRGYEHAVQHSRIAISGTYLVVETRNRFSGTLRPMPASPNLLEVDARGRIRLGPSTWTNENAVSPGARCGLNRDCDGEIVGRHFLLECRSEAVCDTGEVIALPTMLVTGILASSDELLGNAWLVHDDGLTFVSSLYWSVAPHMGCWWNSDGAVEIPDADIRERACRARPDSLACSHDIRFAREHGSVDAWDCPDGMMPPPLVGDRVAVVTRGPDM